MMAKQTLTEQLAEALGRASASLDAAADGHNLHAGDRANKAMSAHGRELGHEASDERAAAASEEASAHAMAALAHSLTELAMRGASGGLGWLAAQLREGE